MKTFIRLLFFASILSFSACEKDERVDMESFVEQMQKGLFRCDRYDLVYTDGRIEYDARLVGGSQFYPMMFFSDGTCRKFVRFDFNPYIPMLYFEYDWEISENTIVFGDDRLNVHSFKNGRFVMEGLQPENSFEGLDHCIFYGHIETDPEVVARYLSCEEYYQFREKHPEFWEPNYPSTEPEQSE